MIEDIDLKKILLRKLNSILNPNYVNKFIFLTFTLGSTLIGKNFLIQLLLSVEIITADFALKIQLSDSADSTVFYFGALLVFISIWLFYKAHIEKNDQSNKSFSSLKKAAPTLIKLMEENERVFKECGPNSSTYELRDLRMDFTVWSNAKSEIIAPNNDQIYKIINTVKKYSTHERNIINKMKSHIEHFKLHVENNDIDYSGHQFPQEFSELIYSYKKVSDVHQNKINELSSWLKLQFSEIDLESAHLFGSFLYNEHYHDVDILIKTNSKTYADIKSVASQLKELVKKCKSEKGENLHISVFSEIEKQDFIDFKNKLLNFEKVV